MKKASKKVTEKVAAVVKEKIATGNKFVDSVLNFAEVDDVSKIERFQEKTIKNIDKQIEEIEDYIEDVKDSKLDLERELIETSVDIDFTRIQSIQDLKEYSNNYIEALLMADARINSKEEIIDSSKTVITRLKTIKKLLASK